MRALLVVVFLCYFESLLVLGEKESFKNRFLSVSMCHAYVDQLQPGNPFHIDKRLSHIDQMYEACIELFEHERPIMAMLNNLLLNNSTLTHHCKSTKLNETMIWARLQSIWNEFTKTIGREEWMPKDKICSLFTNKLNPMFCRARKQKCASAMISGVYAFWYLYAETALNSTTLEDCYTLPHSSTKMKSNPLNPSIYNKNFDLSKQKIMMGNVCESPNKIWLVGKEARHNFAGLEFKSFFGVGLKQFQSFGQNVYEF